jgi:hypothetical protein
LAAVEKLIINFLSKMHRQVELDSSPNDVDVKISASKETNRAQMPLTMSHNMSPLGSKPEKEMQQLRYCVDALWADKIEKETYRDISDMLRLLERAVCARFDTLTVGVKHNFDCGDLSGKQKHHSQSLIVSSDNQQSYQ